MKNVTPKEIEAKNGGRLKPFVKGKSGNPKGRPKGAKSFQTLLRETGMKRINWKDVNAKNKTMTAKQAVVNTLYSRAILGCTTSAKLILEHIGDAEEALGEGLQFTIDENATPEEAARAYKDLIAKS